MSNTFNELEPFQNDKGVIKPFYGRIDFYSMKGEVMESLYYDNKEQFDKEILDSSEIGRPINPKIISEEEYLETDYEEEMEL